MSFLSRWLKEKSPNLRRLFPEASEEDIRTITNLAPFTMTSAERQWALLSSIRYLDQAGIEGDIVECGVWRGGNMMLAKQVSTKVRKFWLYDTFAGMSEPTAADVDIAGGAAMDRIDNYQKDTHNDWCFASLDEVKSNFKQASLLDDNVKFVKGKVEETLQRPENLPQNIALLRLDTDWYESTLAELQVLYPRLASGGVLIVDDYGHWKGARQAFDEYFKDQPILLQRIDYTARMIVKR